MKPGEPMQPGPYPHQPTPQPPYQPPYQPQQGAGPTIVNVHQTVHPGYGHYHHAGGGGPSPGTAALVELLCGLFCGTFGIGHIYGGHVFFGLFTLFGHWFVLGTLVAASTFLVGIPFLIVYWLGMLIVSPIIAHSGAGKPGFGGATIVGFFLFSGAFLTMLVAGGIVIVVASGALANP